MQILSVHKLLCTIDSSVYPLDNVNIILPTEASKVDKYTFKNWDTTIGPNPGISNVLKDAVCIPKVANKFTSSSITDDDCDALDYSAFTINPLTSPGEGVTVFTSPNLSAGASSLGEAKGLMVNGKTKPVLIFL